MTAEVRKILVIKLGALGDFIQALGPMAAIRAHHPQAHITLLTTAPFEDFAAGCKYFDSIWIDQKPGWFNIPGWLHLKKRLNGAGFDRVYDLQNSDRTSFYFNLFSYRPEWVGAAKGASHQNTSPLRTAGHAFDGHVQTLGLAGITGIRIDTLDWLQANITSFAVRRPYVLLVPGSAPEHPQKRWPAENYARIAKILAKWGYQPVVIGGQSEQDMAADIVKNSPDILDLTGQTTLAQVAVLARQAAASIGNDTGPMHLIAATGCPCLSLFSKTSDPVRHAPKGENVVVLRFDNLGDLKSEKVLQRFKPREEPPRSSASLH